MKGRPYGTNFILHPSAFILSYESACPAKRAVLAPET